MVCLQNLLQKLVAPTRERERESKRLRRFVTSFFLILSLLLQNFLFLVNPVYAASSPWTQTDWVGGGGQTSWSDNTMFDSSSSVTTSTAGQATLQATSSWYNASWAYRRKITFDNSAQAENLTNFPVLVKLDSTKIDYSNTQDAGQDIRFTDSDGTTLLSYEIEEWDETATSSIWVKVPQIDASLNTDHIYMYYGNAVAADGQAVTSVWDTNSKGIWHMKDEAGAVQDTIASLTFLERIDDVFPASTRPHMQGAASDGTYLYITQDDQIKKLNKSDYVLVASHDNPHLDGTDMTQVNNIFIYGDYLYLGANNYDNLPKQGYVKVFNKSDLSYVEEHQNVEDHISEGGSFHDNSWWIVYFDWAYVSRYDSSWNHLADYPLQRDASQGNIWIGDYLYVPKTDPNHIEIYHWDGNALDFVKLLSLPDEMDYINGIGKEPDEDILWVSELLYNTNHNNLVKTTINWPAAGLNDSTENANNSTTKSSSEVDGQISKAQNFNGSSNKATITDDDTLDFGTGSFTYQTWVKTDSSTGNQGIIDKRGSLAGDSGFRGYLLWTNGGVLKANISSDDPGNSTVTSVGPSISDGAWHHVAVVVNKATNIQYLYVNGSLVDSDSIAGITGSVSTQSNLMFGYKSTTGATSITYFDGTVDEVRISNTARSAAWIAATYKTEVDTFNTFASEEQEYPSSGTLTSSIFDTEFTGGAAWGTLTFSATTPTSTTATVKMRTSNSSSMTGATAFSSCDTITSGTDISTNNCVTDSHRYAQYLITLGTSAPASTPTFTSYSLTFTAYDADAPSISLTALTPDPNSDNTPTLSGTATDTLGTVSAVQFQMDSTSGSWTACTADDGSFDEASEAFTCTVASALSDGSHTIYVRSTDSNSNTTSNADASTDSFTIDTTAPVSFDLDSPGDNSYTNSERPTFKWKATSDATAGLSKYVLEIDNPSIGTGQPSGDFTIDSIPTSRTTDYETNKYIIHYENFSDSDSTNNYISVYTKSHNDWGSSENDGKLREGRISWKVKAVDNAGNERSSSRTLFVDRTSPSVAFTQINSTPYTTSNFSTTDKTPSIFGKITDSLSGGDSSQTQDENGPKIASAPKEVNIKVEKKEGLTYKLVTLYKINMDNPYYTCDTGKTIDNSKQKCDKYLPFEYTPKENLDLGTYKITLSGKDKSDNTSSETSFTLNITTLAQITTPEEKEIIEEGIKELPKEDQEKVKEELEITKPTEIPKPNILERAGQGVANTSKNIIQGAGNLITTIFTGIGNGTRFVFNGIGSGLAFVGNVIGNSYSALANHAPGVTKNILVAVGTNVNNAINGARNGIANLAFSIGEKTDDVSHGVGTAIIKIGYLFVPEPTKISNVTAIALSPTSVKVSWTTNHPANGKVNWGYDDGIYEFEDQTDKRTSKHEFILENLKPDTEYHYEVMSQNRNYVYDANRKFKTPAK